MLQWMRKKLYIFRVCAHSLIYRPCKAHAPCYAATRGLYFSIIFPHMILETARLSEKFLTFRMCVLIFSKDLAERFLILRRTERDIIVIEHRSSCNVTVICIRF